MSDTCQRNRRNRWHVGWHRAHSRCQGVSGAAFSCPPPRVCTRTWVSPLALSPAAQHRSGPDRGSWEAPSADNYPFRGFTSPRRHCHLSNRIVWFHIALNNTQPGQIGSFFEAAHWNKLQQPLLLFRAPSWAPAELGKNNDRASPEPRPLVGRGLPAPWQKHAAPGPCHSPLRPTSAGLTQNTARVWGPEARLCPLRVGRSGFPATSPRSPAREA